MLSKLKQIKQNSKKGASLVMLLITMTVLMILGSTFGILAKKTYDDSYAKMAMTQAKLTATTTLDILDETLNKNVELRNKLISSLDEVIANNSFVSPTPLEAHQFVLRIPVRYFVDSTAINQEGTDVENITDKRIQTLLASDKFGESFIEIGYTNSSKSEIRFKIVGQYKGYVNTISYLYSRSTNATKELEKILNNSLVLKTPIVNIITHEIKGDIYIDNPRNFKINSSNQAEEINADKFVNIFSGKYDIKNNSDVPDGASTKGHTKKKDFFDREINNPNKWTEVYIRRVFYDQHAERYPGIYGELKEKYPSFSMFDKQLVKKGDIKDSFYRSINGNLIINSDALIGLYDKGGTVFKGSLDYVLRRDSNGYDNSWIKPGQSEHGYGTAGGVSFDYRTKADIIDSSSTGQNIHNTYLGLKGDLFINGNARIENIRQIGNQYITGSAVIAGPRDYKLDNVTFTHWYNVIDGDVYIDGNAYIENTIITGNLYVNGKICEIQQSQIGGNLYVTNTEREDIVPYTVLIGNPDNASELGIITNGKITDAQPGKQDWNNDGRKYIVKDDYYYTHNLDNVKKQLSDISGTVFNNNENSNSLNRKYSNDTPVTNIKYNVIIGGSVKVNTSLILNLSSDIHGGVIANPVKNNGMALEGNDSFLFINSGPHDYKNINSAETVLTYNNKNNNLYTIYGDIRTSAQQVNLSQFYLSNSNNKKIDILTGVSEDLKFTGSIIQNTPNTSKSYLIINSVMHTLSVKQGNVITNANRVIINSLRNENKTGIKGILVPTRSNAHLFTHHTIIRGSLIAERIDADQNPYDESNPDKLNLNPYKYAINIEGLSTIEGSLYVKTKDAVNPHNVTAYIRTSTVNGDIKVDGNIKMDVSNGLNNIKINGDLHASAKIDFENSQATYDIAGNVYSGDDLRLNNAKVMTKKNNAPFAIKTKGKMLLQNVTTFYGNIIAYDRIVAVGSIFRNGKVVSFNDSVLLGIDDKDKSQSVLVRYLDQDGSVLTSINAYTSQETVVNEGAPVERIKIQVKQPDFVPYRKNKIFKGWVLASGQTEYAYKNNILIKYSINQEYNDYNAITNPDVRYPYLYSNEKTIPYVATENYSIKVNAQKYDYQGLSSYNLIYNLTINAQIKPHIFNFENDRILVNNEEYIQDLTFVPYFEDENVNQEKTKKVVADIELDYATYYNYAQSINTKEEFIQKLNSDKVFPEFISLPMDSSLEKLVNVKWSIDDIDFKSLKGNRKYVFYPTKADGTQLYDDLRNNEIQAKILFKNINLQSKIIYKDENGKIIKTQYFVTGLNPNEELHKYRNGTKMFEYWYREGDTSQTKIEKSEIFKDIVLIAKVRDFIENKNYVEKTSETGGIQEGGNNFFFELNGETDLLFPTFTVQKILDGNGNPVEPIKLQLLKNDFELGNLYLDNAITEQDIKNQMPQKLTFKYKDGTLKVKNLDPSKWKFAQIFSNSITTKQRIYYDDNVNFSDLRNGLLKPHYNIYLMNSSSANYNQFTNVVIKDKDEFRRGIFAYKLDSERPIEYAGDTYEGIDISQNENNLISKKLTTEYVFCSGYNVLPDIMYKDSSNNLILIDKDKLAEFKNDFSEVFAQYHERSYILPSLCHISLYKGQGYSLLSEIVFPEKLYLEMSNGEIYQIDDIGKIGNYPKFDVIGTPYNNDVVGIYEIQLKKGDNTAYVINGESMHINMSIEIIETLQHNLTLNIMHALTESDLGTDPKIIQKYTVQRSYDDFQLDVEILKEAKTLFRFGFVFDLGFHFYDDFDNLISSECYSYDFSKTFRENSIDSLGIDIRKNENKNDLYIYPKFKKYSPKTLENNITDNLAIKAVKNDLILEFNMNPLDLNLDILSNAEPRKINNARYVVHTKMFPFTQRFMIKMDNGECVYVNADNHGNGNYNNELLQNLNPGNKYLVNKKRSNSDTAPLQFNFKLNDGYQIALVGILENNAVTLAQLKELVDNNISTSQKTIILFHPDEKNKYLLISELYAKEHLIIGLPITAGISVNDLFTQGINAKLDDIKNQFLDKDMTININNYKKYYLQKTIAGGSLYVNNAYFDLYGLNQKIYANGNIMLTHSIVNADIETGKTNVPPGQYPITISNSTLRGKVLTRGNINIRAQHGGQTFVDNILIDKDAVGKMKVEGPVQFLNPVVINSQMFVLSLDRSDGNFDYSDKFTKFNRLYTNGTLELKDGSQIKDTQNDPVKLSYINKMEIDSSNNEVKINMPMIVKEFKKDNAVNTTINVYSDFYLLSELNTSGSAENYQARFNVETGKIFYINGDYTTSLDRFMDDGSRKSIIYVNGDVEFNAVNKGWQFAKLSRSLIATGKVKINRKYGFVLKTNQELHLHPDIIAGETITINSNELEGTTNTARTEHDYLGMLFAMEDISIILGLKQGNKPQPALSFRGIYTDGNVKITNSYEHLTRWDRPLAISTLETDNINIPHIYGKEIKILSPESMSSSGRYKNRLYFSDGLKIFSSAGSSDVVFHHVYKGGKGLKNYGIIDFNREDYSLIQVNDTNPEFGIPESDLYQKFLTTTNINLNSKNRITDLIDGTLRNKLHNTINQTVAEKENEINNQNNYPIFEGNDNSKEELKALALDLFNFDYDGVNFDQEVLKLDVAQAIDKSLVSSDINAEYLKIDSYFYDLNPKNLSVNNIFSVKDNGFGKFKNKMNDFWKTKMSTIKPWQPYDPATMDVKQNWSLLNIYSYEGQNNTSQRIIEKDTRFTDRLIIPENGELYIRTTNGNINILLERGITVGKNAKIILMGGRFAFMHVKPFSNKKYDLPSMAMPEFIIQERANVGMSKMDPLGQDLVGTDSLFIVSNGPATMKIFEGNTGTFTDISSIPQTQIKAYVYLPNGYMYFKGNHRLVLRGSYCIGTYLLNGDLVKLSSFFANFFNAQDHDYAIMFTYKNLIYSWEKAPIVSATDGEINLGNTETELQNANKSIWSFMGYE